MLITLAALLAFILTLVGVLLAWSPGRPQPYVDANGRLLAGSISEKIRVNINGAEQGMFIKGKDRRNPVLLFVHGGPAMPEYAPLIKITTCQRLGAHVIVHGGDFPAARAEAGPRGSSPSATSLMSSRTTRVSTCRHGRPAEPAFRSWSCGFSTVAIGAISVWP